ncbi:MAG: hypothetical protein ING75_17240 [Rhodocyclaceae bacterium]|nr:hypothetical protein [Rhodocyclaceae bacterium]
MNTETIVKFTPATPTAPGDYKWCEKEGGATNLATLRLLGGKLMQIDVPFERERDPATMGGFWATQPET